MKTKKVIKYHLKKEVKVALVVIVGLAVVIPMLVGFAKQDKEAMEYCMQKNNNYNYCINGLQG